MIEINVKKQLTGNLPRVSPVQAKMMLEDKI